MVYCAGKPIENAVYCLNEPQPCQRCVDTDKTFTVPFFSSMLIVSCLVPKVSCECPFLQHLVYRLKHKNIATDLLNAMVILLNVLITFDIITQSKILLKTFIHICL